MFKNLLVERRLLNGWTLRKVLENNADYESAVSAVASAPYVSTEYAIMSGVKKGVIMSKDPDRVAYTQTLGQRNFDERDDYIIMTNFDFFFHDFREYFDPTGGQVSLCAPSSLFSRPKTPPTKSFSLHTGLHMGV